MVKQKLKTFLHPNEIHPQMALIFGYKLIPVWVYMRLKVPNPVLPKLKVPSKPISMYFVKKYIKTPLFDAKDSYGKMNKLL